MAAANSEVPRSPAASNSGSNSDQEAQSKNDPNSPEIIQQESSERGSSPHSVSKQNTKYPNFLLENLVFR